MSEHNASAVVARMQSAARQENAEGALRLAAIGDLYEIRAPEDDVEKRCWAIDGHLSLVAEVATALAISRKRADPTHQRRTHRQPLPPRTTTTRTRGLGGRP